MAKKIMDLQDLIEALKADRDDIQSIIDSLNAPKNTIEEKLIIEYLVTRSTVRAAELARSLNHSSPNNKTFAPTHMSELINNGSPNISPNLLAMARKIFGANKKAVMYAYG